MNNFMKYRARKAWHFTRCPQDKRTLNRLQNKIHTTVIALTNNTWENTLNSLSDDDVSLWGISKALRKKRAPVSALKDPNNIALSDFDKAEYLACSLKTQIQDNDIINETTDNLTNRIVENYFLNKNNFDDHHLTPPKPSELLAYIKKIKIKKRHFLNSWKTAVIIPILKPGKPPSRPDSYRPISLLPILSKLAEKIILSRLNDHPFTNNILISQQLCPTIHITPVAQSS
ncbi:RNA-directed DNA polymerase from mobile element jockey [Trichonephila clavipes]|nr:RNA-directed DNA polymerase from mobile element jockey [Trichonephila clavipes]